MTRDLIVLIITIIIIIIFIYWIFGPEYTTCTQCGGKAKVIHNRGVWECQEECCMVDGVKYGKYLRY